MSGEIFSTFADALVDKGRAVPSGLAAWNGKQPQRRFGVYRNNVVSGLVEALRSRFPVTEKIVGEAFFRAMAEIYLRAEPPRSPLLLTYGDTFPDFVAEFEPAMALPYLADVLRLEAARSHAYHAADRVPLDPAALSALDPSAFADLVFEPHPSLAVIRSAHPVVTIWAMNAGETPLAPIEPWTGEDALVVRPRMMVNVHHLPPGGAVFVTTLQSGKTLAEAADAGMRDAPDFDLTANLTGLLETGAFAAIA